jgi:hypothetical protein
MTDPTASVPAPNPPAAPWVVEPSTERVDLRDGKAEVTFNVTNPQATAQRAVLDIVPGDAVAASWFTIDGDRQRPVAPNQSTQYKVAIVAPPGTPVASYWFQTRVYAADVAPEESSTLSNRVTFAVTTPSEEEGGGFPWWIIAVVVAVLLVIGVVAFFLTRNGDEPPDFPPPKLVAPANGTTFDLKTKTVPLVWEAVPGAAQYALTVTAPSCRQQLDLEAADEAVAFERSADFEVPTSLPQEMNPGGFGELKVNEEILKLRPGSQFTVCAIRPDVPFDPIRENVSGTSREITFETGGQPTSVRWSVTALDDQGRPGPVSEVRQFNFTPAPLPTTTVP